MLGQHPDLYALPELNLFLADTLGKLIDWEHEVGPERGYLDGLRSAIAQLQFGDQDVKALDRANAWMSDRREWSTSKVFRCLAERVAPRRVVDKSPRASMARSSCARLLARVPEGYYLHLTRHPAAAIRSLASKVDEQGSHVNRFFAQIWVNCQETLIAAMENLDSQHSLRVRGEDLLGSPEEVLREITLWLGLSAGRGEIQQMMTPRGWPVVRSGCGLQGGNDDTSSLPRLSLRTLDSIPNVRDLWSLDLGESLTMQVIQVGNKLGYT